jgi:hypothetical protein
MAQPKKRVMATPEMKGMSMAKKPATMRSTLRAMDQLMALGARAERVDGVALMRLLPEVIDSWPWDGRRIS